MGAVDARPPLTRFVIQRAPLRDVPAHIGDVNADLIIAVLLSLQAQGVIKILGRCGVDGENRLLAEVQPFCDLRIRDLLLGPFRLLPRLLGELLAELVFGDECLEAGFHILRRPEDLHNPSLARIAGIPHIHLHPVVLLRPPDLGFGHLDGAGNARIVRVDNASATGQTQEASDDRCVVLLDDPHHTGLGQSEPPLAGDRRLDPVSVAGAQPLGTGDEEVLLVAAAHEAVPRFGELHPALKMLLLLLDIPVPFALHALNPAHVVELTDRIADLPLLTAVGRQVHDQVFYPESRSGSSLEKIQDQCVQIA